MKDLQIYFLICETHELGYVSEKWLSNLELALVVLGLMSEVIDLNHAATKVPTS